MKTICVVAFAACLTCLASLSAAEVKPGSATTQAQPKPRGLPFYGKVGAVDKKAGTLTLDGKERDRVLRISSDVRIHRDNKPARLDDIVIGQRVGGYIRPGTNGVEEVVTLNLGVANAMKDVTNAPAGPIRPAARAR